LEVEAYSMKHACSLKVPHGSVIYELMAVPWWCWQGHPVRRFLIIRLMKSSVLLEYR
jgi:hypothetical protein